MGVGCRPVGCGQDGDTQCPRPKKGTRYLRQRRRSLEDVGSFETSFRDEGDLEKIGRSVFLETVESQRHHGLGTTRTPRIMREGV